MPQQPTYRPPERKNMGGLIDALHAGLNPDVGQTYLSGIQDTAQARLDDLLARRQAQQAAAQAAVGQLGQSAIEAVSANPSLSQEDLAAMLNAQQETLGLNPKVTERVGERMPGLLDSLYTDTGASVFNPTTGGLDAEDAAAVEDQVGQAVMSGVPLVDILDQVKNGAIVSGNDPNAFIAKAREVYSRYDTDPSRRGAIDAWAENPDALKAKAAELGYPAPPDPTEVAPNAKSDLDYLELARQLYAAQLAGKYGPAPVNPFSG
jgi:hypothetical protein